MARVLRMPEVADDPSDAMLTEWLVRESDAFAGSQSIATVETEKLLVSVEVAEPGVLLKALVEPGAPVYAGTPLAVLGEPGETVADMHALLVELGLSHAPPPVPASVSVEPETTAELTPLPRHGGESAPDLSRLATREIVGDPRSYAVGADVAEDVDGVTPGDDRVRRSRSPRRVLDEIHRRAEDEASPRFGATLPPAPVADAVAGKAAEPEVAAEPEAVMGVRPATAVPQVQLRTTVRAESLLAVGAELHGVSVTDLVVKAVAVAMRRLPELAGPVSSVDIAVQTWNGSETVTPVVRVAALMTLSTLSSTLRDLAARARAHRIDPRELEGASITVVDLGSYGVHEAVVDATSARSVVLAIGAVRDQPVVEAGKVVAGRVVTLTLAVDERLADSVLAARWLGVLTDLLEHPIRFLA